jgi:hypothetical protein
VIATRNGVPIIKDGALATNCGCCTPSPLCETSESLAGSITVSLESEDYRVAVQWGEALTITTAYFGSYTNGDFVLTKKSANGRLAWWSDPIDTPFFTNVTFEPRIGFFPRSMLADSAYLVVPYMLFVEKEESLTTGRSLEFFLEKHSTWSSAGTPDVIGSFSASIAGDCPNGISRIQSHNGQPQLNGGINGSLSAFPSEGVSRARLAWGANTRRVNTEAGFPFVYCQPWIATRPQVFVSFLQTDVGLVLGTGSLNSGALFSDGDPDLWLTGIEANPLP